MPVVNGTTYHRDAPEEVIEILEKLRRLGTPIRLTVDYGYQKTGKSWGERHDVSGYVGRSMGPTKAPLLRARSNCPGGGPIRVQDIVMIRYANKRKGGVLWQHPKYTPYKD